MRCVNHPRRRSVRRQLQFAQFPLQSDHQIVSLLPELDHYLVAEFQPVQVPSAFLVKVLDFFFPTEKQNFKSS
jgi:hypothetical protein